MSDLIRTPEMTESKDCIAHSAIKNSQLLNVRAAQIGDGMTIRRALPHHDRKTIGAWCFLDHFGTPNLQESSSMNIGPHPHIGLQTFTYPLSGTILHRDSLGNEQIIQSQQVNLMTAGRGISHSEESLAGAALHGVQLWIALPDQVRHIEPSFMHYDAIPSLVRDHVNIHILTGEFLNNVSPVKTHTPLIALELHAESDTSTLLPLNPNFEYGILPLIGKLSIDKQVIDKEQLLYLPPGHQSLSLSLPNASRLLIIGGEPFKENIFMWWNFVARNKQEMMTAREAWIKHQNFGEVEGYLGERLTPPEIL